MFLDVTRTKQQFVCFASLLSGRDPMGRVSPGGALNQLGEIKM